MTVQYKTPGVYIEEIDAFPPSIVGVETAVPVFIGYTAKAERKGRSVLKHRLTKLGKTSLVLRESVVTRKCRVVLGTIRALCISLATVLRQQAIP